MYSSTILIVLFLLSTLSFVALERQKLCDTCSDQENEDLKDDIADNIREAVERSKTKMGLLQMSEIFRQFLNASDGGNVFPNSPLYQNRTPTLQEKWVFMIDQMKHMAELYQREMFIVFNEHLFQRMLNLSHDCQSALFKMFIGAKTGEVWTMRLYDSWGNTMPFGALTGTVSSLGDYDECLDVRDESSEPKIYGNYMLMQLRPALPEKPKNYRLGQPVFSLNGTKYANTFWDELAKNSFGFYSMNLTRGICMPSACKTKDVEIALGGLVEPLFWNIYIDPIYESDAKDIVSFPQFVAIIVTISLVTLVLICSLCDYLKLGITQWNNLKFMHQFSILPNSLDLFDTNATISDISFLRGLTCLAVLLVILVNGVIAGGLFEVLALLGIRAKDDVMPMVKSLPAQIFMNISWLVDFFMVTSGFMLAVNNLVVDSNGKYVRRRNIFQHLYQTWVKLGPPVVSALLMLFILPLLTSGPLTTEYMSPLVRNCESRWYYNLLFISNWWNLDEVCMYPSWFFSITFQLHVFAFFVIYLYCRQRKLGFLVSILLIIYGSLSSALTTIITDTLPFLTLTRPILADVKESLYFMLGLTSTSATGFFVGFITGLVYLDRTRRVHLVGTIAIGAVSVVISGIPYIWNKDQEEPSLLISLLLSSIQRLIWSMGMAFSIFTIARGKNRTIVAIHSVLNLGVWQPLSRLCSQLLATNIIVVWYFYLTRRVPVIFRLDAMGFQCAGILVASLILAYFGYIFLEKPLRVLLLHLSSKIELLCEKREQILLDDANVVLNENKFERKDKIKGLNSLSNHEDN